MHCMWQEAKRTHRAQGTVIWDTEGRDSQRLPKCKFGFTNSKGSYSTWFQIRGVKSSSSSCSQPSHLKPLPLAECLKRTSCGVLYSLNPSLSVGSRRVGVAVGQQQNVTAALAEVLSSGSNTRATPSLANGSFHHWLHPRQVWNDPSSCHPPRQFVSRWQEKAGSLQESDLHAARWW